MSLTFPYELKGKEIYITMKSGAVYRGIFQRLYDIGGGKILLQDVKCCSRTTLNWLVCPKYGMNRKFWVSKTDHFVLGENT